MKINIKSKNEILDELVYQIRDGIVLIENEPIVYDSAVTTYEFSASTEKGTPTVINIIYLSGLTSDNNYIDNLSTINGIDPLVEGTDYDLWVSGGTPDIIDDNPYSTSHWAGTSIYDGIEFITNKLKDGETFFVTYMYYDNAKVSQITNFSEGTLAKTLVDSIANTYRNIYDTLDVIDKNSYLGSSTGEAVDKHGSLYGLTRYKGTVSNGYVVVTNTGTDILNITPSNVFVTERTTDAVLFRSSASYEIAVDETKEIFVTSTEVGKDQNVGVGTITKIYLSDSLEEEISNNYSSTNPSYISGAINLFDSGTDREGDIAYVSRVRRTTTRGVTSRKDTIQNAVDNLSSISFSKVQDWEENKLIQVGSFDVLVVGEGSKLITKGNLENIRTVIDDYKPIGTVYNIKRPHPVYIDIDLSIYIPTEHWSNKTSIENTVSTSVSDYVSSLTIGEDFKQSQLLKNILKKSTELENAIIDDLFFTVYSYDPYEFDSTNAGYQVVDGTTDHKYAQGFFCTTKNHKNKQTYHSSTHLNAEPLTAYDGYVEDTDSNYPMTYLAIEDSYGVDRWIRDPRYTIDYTDGKSLTNYEYKVIDPTNGNIVGRPLVDDDNVIYDYYYVKYDVINGVRFWLEMNSVADGLTCDIDIYYGGVTDEPTTKVGGVTGYSLTYANVDSNDLLAVDVEFTSPLTLVTGLGGSGYNDDPATQFWLVIQNWSGNTGGTESVKVYMSKMGDEIIPYGTPDVMVDEGAGWIDIVNAGAGTDWVNRYANIRTTLNIVDNSSYFDNDKDVEADLYSKQPEIIVLNELNITSDSVVID